MAKTILKRLAILGASGHGKVVADIAERNGYQVFFFDDAYPDKGIIEHWKVFGTTAELLARLSDFDGVAIGIGNNDVRAQKYESLITAGAELPNLIDPSSCISQYVQMGAGCVVMANAVINSFAVIGNGVIINTSSVVEHDCKVGEFSHICPNASIAGGVSLASRVWFGVGSSARQMISVGEGSLVGAGSVVVKDIPAGVTVFGNPAKVVKE